MRIFISENLRLLVRLRFITGRYMLLILILIMFLAIKIVMMSIVGVSPGYLVSFGRRWITGIWRVSLRVILLSMVRLLLPTRLRGCWHLLRLMVYIVWSVIQFKPDGWLGEEVRRDD